MPGWPRLAPNRGLRSTPPRGPHEGGDADRGQHERHDEAGPVLVEARPDGEPGEHEGSQHQRPRWDPIHARILGRREAEAEGGRGGPGIRARGPPYSGPRPGYVSGSISALDVAQQRLRVSLQ